LDESNEKLHLKTRFLTGPQSIFLNNKYEKEFYPMEPAISLLSWFIYCCGLFDEMDRK